MTAITASNIPSIASEAKITDFFTFCGKIKSVNIDQDNGKTKTVDVEFESPAAVSTALLLNGAEFEGNAISVQVSNTADSSNVSQNAGSKTAADSDSTKSDHDIAQEDKPKSTILAEYLANGYVLSDNLVQKAVDFDQKHGISDSFKSFISGLDNKYHLHEKNTQLYNQANSQFDLENRLEKSKRTMDSYLDKFKKDKYGSRIHDFYTNVAKDAKDVHEEALRLAELKQPNPAGDSSNSNKDSGASVAAPTVIPTISTITPDSTTAAVASAVPFETDEKK